MNEKIEFLQSENWLGFQEATGKKVIRLADSEFSANGIIRQLPLVGRYLYVPRGPVFSNFQFSTRLPDGQVFNFQKNIQKLFEEAEEKKVKWIRIEPKTEEILESIKKTTDKKIVKAPHDMQPREIFVVDLSPSEEELLSAMKPKTRYNIRLAEKHEVWVFATREKKYTEAFLDLVQKTADRKEITPHPHAYYEKMLDTLPEEMCRLFIAEYEGEIIAANILIIFGETAVYLHGGSSDKHRDAMAPYLLQWEQMKFAKEHGCVRYDFGGIRSQIMNHEFLLRQSYGGQAGIMNQEKRKNDWKGITKFKTGFSPKTASAIFPGAYDIILNPQAYFLYRCFHNLKKCLGYVRKFVS